MAINNNHSDSAKKLPFIEIKEKLSQANSILILLPQNHTVDSVAAGLSLYLGLGDYFKDTQKELTIATPTQITVAYQRLYGINNIQNKLGSRNLVVTLETNYQNIEKITSDNEDNKLNIIIETKKGVQKLNDSDISFSYRGIETDLIISLDHNTPEDSGKFLLSEKKLFEDNQAVNISTSSNASAFAQINCTDPQLSGVSEIISKLLRFLKIDINPDIATNLIAGIESATNNLSIKTSSDTFAALSWLMKQNGKRFHLRQNPNSQANSFSHFYPKKTQTPIIQPVQNIPQTQPAVQPVQTNPNPIQQTPQEDWTQPKIYNTGVSKS